MKTGEDEKGGKKGLKRDQCKTKKFWDMWDALPEEIRSHVEGLKRDEQTRFIHSNILREGGRLIPQLSTMWELMV